MVVGLKPALREPNSPKVSAILVRPLLFLKALSYDEMLDLITLYWLTNSAASSGRLYWESYKDGFFAVPLDLPVGCSVFAKEIYCAPRSWAEQCMSDIVYWGEVPKGGHFAAFEQPHLFVDEMRSWMRQLNGAGASAG